jgi:parallel beta-helix repeat protein
MKLLAQSFAAMVLSSLLFVSIQAAVVPLASHDDSVLISSSDFIPVANLGLETGVAPLLTNSDIGGIIATDTIWYATQSPYTVTGNVTVVSNATLSIEPGVTVRFRKGCGMIVQGRLLADGTTNQPITFTRYPGDATWERIQFVKAADSRFLHCVIEFANCVGDHKDYFPTNCSPKIYPPRNYHEAVVALACHIDFVGCSFTNLPSASATAEGDAIAIISDDPDYPGPASAIIQNCNFIRIGQGVHTRYAYVLVEHCVFKDKHGDNDDVDLLGESTPPPIIRNNLFLVPSYDDRIHPTSCSALIYGNTIYGSTDHGIVLRDVSRPIVMNNVLYNCSAGGITVQNQCDALIVNNTLVNCNKAIKLFDHTDRWGPPYCLTPGSGRATVINCLIWNCNPAFDLANSPYPEDRGSHVTVIHCDVQGGPTNANVSANSTLTWGLGNMNANPLFASLASTNFHLSPGSPCIDAGTNASDVITNGGAVVTNDFDGLRRPLDGNGDGLARFDIGAFEYLLSSADSNGDGIPDGWCQRYGLNPIDPQVAAGDPDLDAYTTFQEWVADTDPTNALSYFHIAAITSVSPLAVAFQSSSNRQYTLYFCTNLDGGHWTQVMGQANLPGTGSLSVLQDTNAIPPTFYRVGVNMP